jgi:putative Holliday junction resolvase
VNTTSHPPAPPGRALGVDLGEKRIGLALSDTGRLIASAHGMMARKSRAEDFARFGHLVAEQGVTLVVMGLPITLAGHEGDRAAWVRNYAEDLRNHLPVPIVYWDESLTTKEAEASLRAQGKRRRKIKENVDAVAAALILQSYLDSARPQPDLTHDLD